MSDQVWEISEYNMWDVSPQTERPSGPHIASVRLHALPDIDYQAPEPGCGIRATAELRIGGAAYTQVIGMIHTAGLWGIEADHNDDSAAYRVTIANEQLDELSELARALGCDPEHTAAAIDEARTSALRNIRYPYV